MPGSSVPLVPSRLDRPAPALPNLRTALMRVVLWPARMVSARREFAQIAGLTDRELKDIGLTRQDVRNATGLARDQDATSFLAAAAAERSLARWRRSRARAEGREGRQD